ncbi:TetR family transcriptional regulator [Paractinoplanes deccanensis]|uniref:TetR family transcriptional regulator n=1 Tax=Paractinoplanes deccanensis TaxID=113561 RepID=A0ABQ3YAG7_9ACTN|nr:TetR/AcrR family transcriptional regulator [Actinoplanes deccanensis]GID77015.1 TetR family transcriptional regulator [Actinoplanes deccanensis]
MARDTRDRIIREAARLLAEQGRDAVTTRSVAAAAGVQPPALYRLFGDKDGLLDAVAVHGMRGYLDDKDSLGETGDPVGDLARAWDLHVGFGLAEPACYLLVFGEPRPGGAATARREAIARLRHLVERVAAAGRLRTSVERATALMHSGGVGVVVSQLGVAPAERDPGVARAMWETVRAAIVTGRPAGRGTTVAAKASALRQALPEAPGAALTEAERSLLAEWLGRLSDAR